MLRKLWNKFRYWRCKRLYSRLSETDKKIMDFMGVNPEQLRKDGKFG